jgi:hypothetical protein
LAFDARGRRRSSLAVQDDTGRPVSQIAADSGTRVTHGMRCRHRDADGNDQRELNVRRKPNDAEEA